MVRLVKGATVTANQRAQEMGLAGYPFSRTSTTTDIGYLACAPRLISHAD